MRLRKNGKKIHKDKEQEGKANKKLNEKFIHYIPFIIFALLTSLLVIKKFSIENIVGSIIITGLIYFIFYKDIKRYNPDYIKRYRMILLVGILIPVVILISIGFNYFFVNFSHGIGLKTIDSVVIYGMPIAMGAVIVTLIFDFHTAIIFSFTLSLLFEIWTLESLYSVYVFLSSLVGAFSVIRCKKRADLLKAGLYISGVNIITLTGILLLKGEETFKFIQLSYMYAAISGIVVSAMVSIVLPVIEALFKVTTDITLLELLDLNQPLMKNLMIAAPGTYHHSIIVGNLVEPVAEDIGVNPLLARVGAYYHDIGKIRMPDYFIENQTGAVSKHDRLTPHMSSIILSSHVKEGVEIAKEFKLPEPIIDIIQQHHGTCLMTYFYQKAKDSAEVEPKEEDYRYQGPKPKSRVAALVMLADAVEAASRVLKDPTPARIEALVEKVVNHIFIDGQLEDCELTLKDISIIKKKFIYILTGILHSRVEYPGFEFEKKVKNNVQSQT